MSVYIHEPMNSPKISRKGCQMKIRYRKCKNYAGRLPFSRRLCSPFCEGFSRITFGTRQESQPSRQAVLPEKQPKKYLEKHGYVTRNMWLRDTSIPSI